MPQKPKPLDDSASVRAWFGVELRNWRTVRGLSSAALGHLVHVSATTVERIEKNERTCGARLAADFDCALGAGGALIRLWRRVESDRQQERDADIRSSASGGSGTLVRRRFLAASGAAALTPNAFADLVPTASAVGIPTVIRSEDIDQVRSASRVLADWDHLYGGGGLVRQASISQFNWAKGLLDAKCPARLTSQLHTVVGRLAVVVGGAAFDAHEHQDSGHLLDFAAACAEAADDWHLRAIALNKRARQAIWTGAPDVGLTYADSGLVRADRLTPREQSMLHNARARALAKMGRRQDVLAAVGQSDDIFSRSKHGEDGPWMAYYDHAQHHGDTGHALFDVALLPSNSPRTASERLRIAVNEHTDAYPRSRAMSGTKLATLLFLRDDPREAVHVAGRALDGIGRLRSKRAVTDVRALSVAAATHPRLPEAAALRTRIDRITASA